MNYLQLEYNKQQVENAVEYITTHSSLCKEIKSEEDIKFYRFLFKHILFFKNLYLTYPKNFEIRVIISDFLSYVVNDIEKSIRYNHLIERSIIENYMRLSLLNNDDEEITHITSKEFDTLKDISDGNKIINYEIIISSYKVNNHYIHGNKVLENHLSLIIEDSMLADKITGKQKAKDNARKTKLIKALDSMLFLTKREFIDDAFHRNKSTLSYLINSIDTNEM